jgi:coenzyme F420 hydrogenase subunit delta
MLRPLFEYDCLVLGCGNPLIGDDGFGPAVIQQLEEAYAIPESVACIDVGTSVRDILFDLILSEKKPHRIIIVDAADSPGVAPGEIREITIGQIQPAKSCDFSLHQFPTTNMLKELQEETAIDVRVFVVQVAGLPDEVMTGLSAPVQSAIPRMCAWIMAEIGSTPTSGGSHD